MWGGIYTNYHLLALLELMVQDRWGSVPPLFVCLPSVLALPACLHSIPYKLRNPESPMGCSEFITATCRDSMHQRTLETRLARYAARAFRYSFLAASVFLLYACKDQIMKNYDRSRMGCCWVGCTLSALWKPVWPKQGWHSKTQHENLSSAREELTSNQANKALKGFIG